MNAPANIPPKTPPYKHTPLFPLGKDNTTYRKISADGVRVETVMGREVLVVSREAMRALSEAAFADINHLLRPAHLASLKSIVEDPEASDNDKFVAFDFLKNANIAAGGVLPMCQDTGTAIIMGKKGRLVFTDGEDEAALAGEIGGGDVVAGELAVRGRILAQRERSVRRARSVEERQHRRRRRAADVPGHRHGDRDGQEGPGGVDRRRRRGGDRPRRVQDLYRDQPAL